MIAERNTSGRFRPWRNEDMNVWVEEEFRLLLPLALDALRQLIRDP